MLATGSVSVNWQPNDQGATKEEEKKGKGESLPALLEALDDGTNEATLQSRVSHRALVSCSVSLYDSTWTPSGLMAMKLCK